MVGQLYLFLFEYLSYFICYHFDSVPSMKFRSSTKLNFCANIEEVKTDKIDQLKQTKLVWFAFRYSVFFESIHFGFTI